MTEKKVRELVAELAGSEEFKQLKEARRKVEEDGILKSRVEQFFRASAEAYGSKGGFDEAALQKKFAEVTRSPEIAAYFEAGHKFDSMVMQIHQLLDRLIEKALTKNF